MKPALVIVALFCALTSFAQTNSIIFPQLLSPTNSVLMTNAEFRCFSGAKIFFKNDDGYKSFTAAELNTNVLAALHVTAAGLDAKQASLERANADYARRVLIARQQQAAQDNSKFIHYLPNGDIVVGRPTPEMIEQQNDQNLNPAVTPPSRPIKIKVDDGYPDKSEGNFIGN